MVCLPYLQIPSMAESSGTRVDDADGVISDNGVMRFQQIADVFLQGSIKDVPGAVPV
jgi:hypothetical protein